MNKTQLISFFVYRRKSRDRVRIILILNGCFMNELYLGRLSVMCKKYTVCFFG